MRLTELSKEQESPGQQQLGATKDQEQLIKVRRIQEMVESRDSRRFEAMRKPHSESEQCTHKPEQDIRCSFMASTLLLGRRSVPFRLGCLIRELLGFHPCLLALWVLQPHLPLYVGELWSSRLQSVLTHQGSFNTENLHSLR